MRTRKALEGEAAGLGRKWGHVRVEERQRPRGGYWEISLDILTLIVGGSELAGAVPL